jgi:Nif-specific regulatory protein
VRSAPDGRGAIDDPERIRRERDLYRRLLELGEEEALDAFLGEALGLLVEVTGAQHGYIELRDAAEPRDRVASLAQGRAQQNVEGIRLLISRGVVAATLASGMTVETDSALLDERFAARESVRAHGIQAVLCVPVGGAAAHGVVYLQNHSGGGPFSRDARHLADLFARHVAPLSERFLIRRRYEAARDATQDLRQRFQLDAIVGRSRALADALHEAMLAAPLDVTVLVTGPSGSGKSQLAHAIHLNSRRAQGPFVELNCAAIPQTLIESELFGARSGSHSEARRDMPGKVEAADGGTLFLDEIAELSWDGQAKLLQFLHSRQYCPLGEPRALKADVRLVAATNADLEQRVRDKKFREDLYFRINVLPVSMPPLTERAEDLDDLAVALLRRVADELGLGRLRLSGGALHAIQIAEWPGNVRQLENVLRAAAIRAAGAHAAEIGPRHLFPARGEQVERSRTFQEATRRFQCDLVARTLDETSWNVREAAARLEIARSYLYQLIQTFGLRRDGVYP